MILPFLSLGLGILLGWTASASAFVRAIERLITFGLILLMLALGAKIGGNEGLFTDLPRIGMNCLIIAFLAILMSVLCTVLIEKTMLPLHQLRHHLTASPAVHHEESDSADGFAFAWIMPVCILSGIAAGRFLLPEAASAHLDSIITISLILLYVGVGVSFGINKWVFSCLKTLGWRIFLLSAAITAGSLSGGILSGLLLGLPHKLTVCATAGMSYYSLTGAVLTQNMGIEAGTYGFLVNVIREILTILLLPISFRVSPGSPIACGAAGCMDTMLAPITRFTGIEFGIVALVTGTTLTLLVPFLLTALTLFL